MHANDLVDRGQCQWLKWCNQVEPARVGNVWGLGPPPAIHGCFLQCPLSFRTQALLRRFLMLVYRLLCLIARDAPFDSSEVMTVRVWIALREVVIGILLHNENLSDDTHAELSDLL